MQLVIKNVSKRFKKNHALDRINLKLDEGVYGLLGPNGAGKTTLFRCITGLYGINDGVIGLIDEVDGIIRLKPEDIGYLPQKFGIFKNVKVKDMLQYFAVMKNITAAEMETEVTRCLSLVHLEDKRNDKVRTLSGGMVRRLGIAQALLGDPKLLLLDEPTVGLDPQERVRFQHIVNRIAQGKIVVISTHIVEDVEAVCNKIVIMNGGKVVKSGKKQDLIETMGWHVYEIREDEIHKIPTEHQKLRIISKGNDSYQRVLLKEQIASEECEATLEDAYHEYISTS